MGLVETQAIVLRTYKLAEADKIVVCFTDKFGLVRGVARGARRLKSRFGAGLEPFTVINLTYYEKEGRELLTFKQAEILHSYFNLAKHSEAVAALDHLTGLVMDFSPPHLADVRVFRMLRACVAALADGPSEAAAVASYGELWLLRLAGFLPELCTCGECRRELDGKSVYIATDGVLRCGVCARESGSLLDKDIFMLLAGMRNTGPSQWAKEYGGLSPKKRQELSEISRRLIRRVLEREARTTQAMETLKAETDPTRPII